MELIGVFSFDNGRSRRIIFDVFISLEAIISVTRKLVNNCRPAYGYLAACYCEIHCSDKINFPI
jgi:hypothetical protein